MTDNPIQRTVKGYELRKQIGVGGFGAVYRAYQPVVDREVAIKVILPEYADHPDFIRRFEIEAQLIARLEHLHIVPLYDFWREPGGAYLVMRYLRGGNLRTALHQRGAFQPAQAAKLLDQIASALSAAHSHDVIHRDIKPENILLDQEGNAYLADFGIAKDLTTNTVEYEQLGTAAYAAPEQITGGTLLAQSDIYSLGVILYEMLSGSTPFDAPSETLILEQRRSNTPIPPLHRTRDDLPMQVNDVIWQALSPNPLDRFPDAMLLAAEFRRSIGEPVDEKESARFVLPSTGAARTTRIIMNSAEPKNPYKGLRPFAIADAGDFFGREEFVERVINRLRESDFIVCIGASGSGKSSAIMAGVIPMLRQGAIPMSRSWFITTMTPGSDSFAELTSALLSVSTRACDDMSDKLRRGEWLEAIELPGNSDARLVLVIDQFEELFTLVSDEAERLRFLQALLTAVTAEHRRLKVILTLRADFYDRPLMYAGFGDLVRRNTEVILPLTLAEMERAIERPAEKQEVRFERGLVSTIIEDVNEQPGALPLLQYALTELFEQRTGRLMTLEAYRASGGILGALTRRADEIYDGLDADAQAAAQQVFLRLVDPVTETRRRAPLADFTGIKKEALRAALDAFGKYRLLTFDHDPSTRAPTVEIAHEALIGGWARLRGWIDASRDDLRLYTSLTAAADEWQTAGRDRSFLAQGTRLVAFEPLLESQHIVLSEIENAYLLESIAARRRAQILRSVLIVTLSLITLIAVVSALFAFEGQQRAQRENQISRSRELAAAALVNANRLDLALLLSIEGLNAYDTFEARNSLLTELQASPHLTAFLHTASGLRGADFSPDGKTLAVGARDGTLYFWDVQSRTLIQSLTAPHMINALAFSPDGNKLATAGGDGTIILWDTASRTAIGEPIAAHTTEARTVAFSPDGSLIASGGDDNMARVWDAESGDLVNELEGHAGAVFDVAFSPDGSTIASGSADMTIMLWDADSGELIAEPLTGHTNWVYTVAFSADGSWLATAGADNTIRLWDVASGSQLTQLLGHQNWIRSLAFSADNQYLASASADGTVRLWDMGLGTSEVYNGHRTAVWELAFSPDGYTLASVGVDPHVLLWDTRAVNSLIASEIQTRGAIQQFAVSPDGERIAAAVENLVILWDANSGEQLESFNAHGQLVTAVAFSPNGAQIATAGGGGVRLWNADTLEQVHEFSPGTGAIYNLAFSPQGRRLAVAADGGTTVWDTTSGERLAQYEESAFSVAFSPDARTLVIGERDGYVSLWSEGSTEPRRLDAHSDGVMGVAFNPDGTLLASIGRDSMLHLWETATGELVRRFTGHSNWGGNVAFSPDGLTLASVDHDGGLRLWDIDMGLPLGQTFIGHRGWINRVAFNGTTLLTGGQDGRLVAWDTSVERWQDAACGIANRALSQEEWARYFPDQEYRETCPPAAP